MKERPILFSAPMVRAILAGQKTQTRRIVKANMSRETSLVEWNTAECAFVPWRWHTGSSPAGGARTGKPFACPYGKPGDRLWVRETWYCDNYTERDFNAARVGHVTPRTDEEIIAEWRESLYYRADTATGMGSCCELIPECMCAEYKTKSGRARSPWKPGIHMPRWASRITLEVTGVRVERLQNISEDDAKSEGVEGPKNGEWPEGFGSWSHNGNRVVGRPWAHQFLQLWMQINGHESAHANPWVWVVEFRHNPSQGGEG